VPPPPQRMEPPTDASTAVKYEPRIHKNVTIDGIDVSGMSYDEALTKLGGDSAKRAKISVNLSSSYGDVKTTLGDIGYTNDAPQVVEEAVKAANTGNVLTRYKEEKELEKKPLNLEVKRSVNKTMLGNAIQKDIGETLHRDAEYSLVKHDDGTVSVTMGGGNVDADSEATAQTIDDILNHNWSGGCNFSGYNHQRRE
jgi:Putative peptidoglycan binding domain.